MSNKMFNKKLFEKKIKKFMKNCVHFLKIWYNNNINKRKTPRREKKKMKEWTKMYSKVCGNNESREYANSLMENGKYEMKEAIRIAYDRFFSK